MEIKYKIESYERAERIVRGFDRGNRIYLKSLVSSVTGNPEYADRLDYRGLLHEGLKIRGIAQKMLKDRLISTMKRANTSGYTAMEF